MSYFIRRHVVFALTFMILLLMLSWFAFAPRPVEGLDYLERASEEREITLVNHLGENYIISAIAIQDDYAYMAADASLGSEPGMAVLDVSDPRVPREVSFLALAEQADDMFVAEGYVFAHVADEHKIIDISSPTRPREVGQLSGEQIKAVEGNRVYVRDGEALLRIWDISDPTAALEVAHYAYDGHSVEVANHHAYVLEETGASPTGATGVRIVNLSEPSAPIEVGWLEIEGTAIAVRDQSLFISWGECHIHFIEPGGGPCISCEGGIRVFDLSQPTNPIEVDAYQTDVAIERMVVKGDYALTYTHYCWAVVHREVEAWYFDIRSLSDFTRGFSAPASRYTHAAAAKDDYLYLAYGRKGVEIWHEAPDQVRQVGTYGTQATVRDVVVVDDYAFLVGDAHTLRVVDVSDPAFPIEVAILPGNGKKMALVEHYAYVSGNSLHIIDITDPTAPTELGSYQYGGLDVAIGDGYAYLGGCCYGSVSMIDISDPTNPTSIGFVDVVSDTVGDPNDELKQTTGLVVEANYIYAVWQDCDADYNYVVTCSDYGGGFSIIDVSNPITPTLVRVIRGSVGPAIEVKDQYAYVGYFQNLQIFDVSDPTNPTAVGSHSLSGSPKSLTIKNHHAYLATEAGITVLDISDPTSPQEVASYAIPTASSGVTVSDGYIYSANGNWGLITLQVGSRLAGRVSHANGLPFSGVLISSTAELSATTNSEGRYAFVEQASGTYTLTPTHASFLFSPPTQRVTVPPNATANFTILSAPVSVTLPPASNTTLTISDTQGLLTDLEWPAGSVRITTTLRLTPTLAANEANFAFAAHAFELMAYQNGHQMPDFTFNTPFTITLRYSEADVRLISHKNQNQLALWWQQDDTWQDATQSCHTPTAYQRDTSNKQISVPICRIGRLALFGPTHQLYLPLLFR
ncbi:MAG: carboxypeptidase regulatory-like domain-containing protein [Ardenticatenaceae bacterium]